MDSQYPFSDELIPTQLNRSPVFIDGLGRDPSNVNRHVWSEMDGNIFDLGVYPPMHSIFDFNDLSQNCSILTQSGSKSVTLIPASCTEIKAPYICQIQAYDTNHN